MSSIVYSVGTPSPPRYLNKKIQKNDRATKKAFATLCRSQQGLSTKRQEALLEGMLGKKKYKN
eukprot:COSAG01_NODE_313_length_19043_cov_3.917177_16_plen_63_part_00